MFNRATDGAPTLMRGVTAATGIEAKIFPKRADHRGTVDPKRRRPSIASLAHPVRRLAASGCLSENHPAKLTANRRPRYDDGIEAEAAAVMMQRKAQHEQHQEEIRPGPLAGRAVQA